MSGLDAQEILNAMPAWRTGTSEYRSVRSPGVGRLLQPGSPVHLTMHGLVHCDVPALADSSIAVVLGLIRQGLAAQQSTVAESPTSLVSVVFTRDQVAAVAAPFWPTPANEIFHLLQSEPDLNAVVGGVDDQVPWTWDVTLLPLHRYSGIGAGQDYLAALDARLQETAALAPTPVLPPLALPDAFDQRRAGMAARLNLTSGRPNASRHVRLGR